ncbi:MAG: SNF2-related protein [Micrococcaceae bacterium]
MTQLDDSFKQINLRNVCLIDNYEDRFKLSDVLRKIVTEYYPEYESGVQPEEQHEKKCLSIAVGYIDLPGIELLFKFIKNFDKIRILIGRDPEPTEIQKEVRSGFYAGKTREELREEIEKLPDPLLADYTLADDLEELAKQIDDFYDNPDKTKIKYFKLIEGLLMLINEDKLELKIYDKAFRIERLHAKAFIFGYDDLVVKAVSENQVKVAEKILADKQLPTGKSLNQKQLDKIVDNKRILQKAAEKEVSLTEHASTDAFATMGSSNFTRAGLKTSKELNTYLDTTQFITGLKGNSKHSLSYLEWFEEMWTHLGNEDWSGEFSEVVKGSKLYNSGKKANDEQKPEDDLFPTKKDAYIKALLEAYPEVKTSREKLDFDDSWFYDFQKESVGRLRYRLREKKLAILADSVGLGKTITAGGVIVEALNEGKSVCIIAPSVLTNQWIDELSDPNKFNLKIASGAVPAICKKNNNLIKHTSPESKECQDLTILSMENMNEIRKAKEPGSKDYDLFVIDEVHKLKSQIGTRNNNIKDLLRKNMQSQTLMLTATPLSNTLNDFNAYLDIGLKDDASIVEVTVDGSLKKFNKFLDDIMSEVTKVRKELKRQEALDESLEKKLTVDWKKYEEPLNEGFRTYMVRNTRQEIVANERYKKSGLSFPKDHLGRIKYDFTDKENADVKQLLDDNKKALEGLNPEKISLGGLAATTKRFRHPINLLKEGQIKDELLPGENKDEDYSGDSFTEIFKLILLLGFVPHKTTLYRKDIFNANNEELEEILKTDSDLPHLVKTQASIHNIMRVSYLKRAESSLEALTKTLDRYNEKLKSLKTAIKAGKVSVSSVEKMQTEASDEGAEDEKIVTEKTIEEAFEDISNYDEDALKKDIARDQEIIELLKKIINVLKKKDDKIQALALALTLIKEHDSSAKILVFSEFADTVNYLKNNLEYKKDLLNETVLEPNDRSHYLKFYNQEKDKPKQLMREYIESKWKPNTKKVVGGFKRLDSVLGGDKDIEQKVALFSPVSKGYDKNYCKGNKTNKICKLLENKQKQTNILLATDALSEGQNIQDANYIINFDVPWNPVRIIQRNGRINRLRSSHKDIYIFLLKPEGSYKLFLRLMDVVDSKIDMLTNTGLADVNITEQGQISNTTWKLLDDETSTISEEDSNENKVQKTSHQAYLEKYLNQHHKEEVLERLSTLDAGLWFNTAQAQTGETLMLAKEPKGITCGKYNDGSTGLTTLNTEEFLNLVESQDNSISGLSNKSDTDKNMLAMKINQRLTAKKIAYDISAVKWNKTEADKLQKLVDASNKIKNIEEFRELNNHSVFSSDIRAVLKTMEKGNAPTQDQLEEFEELFTKMKLSSQTNTAVNKEYYYYASE